MGRVVVVGSVTVDLVTVVERAPAPGETVAGRGLDRVAGGRGVTQAVVARESGADVTLVAAVGDDDAGRTCADRLRHNGIEPALTVVPDTPTGHALVVVDENGDRTTVVIAGANAHLPDSALAPLDDLGPGDVVLLQVDLPPILVTAAARRAHAMGARVVLGLSPYVALPHDVVALADPVVVDEEGAALLADGDRLPTSLLVTFAGAGSSWDGQRAYAPARPPEVVVDPVDAGDACCGALAAALAGGADRASALARAIEAGARAGQRHAPQSAPSARDTPARDSPARADDPTSAERPDLPSPTPGGPAARPILRKAAGDHRPRI